MWCNQLTVMLALALTLAIGCAGDDGGDGGEGRADAAAVSMADAGAAVADAAGGGGTGAATDAATATLDADVTGIGEPSTVVSCGASDCPRDTEVCCFTGFPTITQSCTAPSACDDLIAVCDGPEDCPSDQICCGDQTGATCKPASACVGFTASQLCHSDPDCADGKVCRPSTFVAWPICKAP
jgi:hypothetical protein